MEWNKCCLKVKLHLKGNQQQKETTCSAHHIENVTNLMQKFIPLNTFKHTIHSLILLS